jgi:hypothetical protein
VSEFIIQTARLTIFIDPAGDSVQHESDRWIVRRMNFPVRHGALLREIGKLFSHAFWKSALRWINEWLGPAPHSVPFF